MGCRAMCSIYSHGVAKQRVMGEADLAFMHTCSQGQATVSDTLHMVCYSLHNLLSQTTWCLMQHEGVPHYTLDVQPWCGQNGGHWWVCDGTSTSQIHSSEIALRGSHFGWHLLLCTHAGVSINSEGHIE